MTDLRRPSVRKIPTTRSIRTPLAFELVALPLAVSIRQNLKITAVLLLLLLFLSALRRDRVSERLNLVPAGFLLVLAAIVFRQGPLTLAAIYVLTILVLVVTAKKVTRATAYESLLAGMALYLVANVAGWLIGIQSPAAAIRVGELGTSSILFGTRIIFPFAISINEPAFIAGAMISAVITIIAIRSRPRWYLWLGSIAGAVVMLGSNSRAAVLVAAAVSIALLMPRLARVAAPYVVAIAMLLPFVIQVFLPIISALAEFGASSSFLSRGGTSQQLSGIGSRGIIWTKALDYWTAYVTDFTYRLIGYGYNGHVSSGAWLSFSSGVTYISDRRALTAHNSILQTVYDAGLIGSAILLGVTVYTIFRYSREANLLQLLAVGVIVAVSAAVEVSLTPGFGCTAVLLLTYLAVFIPNKPNKVAPPRGSNLLGSAIVSTSRH